MIENAKPTQLRPQAAGSSVAYRIIGFDPSDNFEAAQELRRPEIPQQVRPLEVGGRDLDGERGTLVSRVGFPEPSE
jgi:hypothetical protein